MFSNYTNWCGQKIGNAAHHWGSHDMTFKVVPAAYKKNWSTLTHIQRYFLCNATFESSCIFSHLPCTVTTREPPLTPPRVPPSLWQTCTAPTIQLCTLFQSSSFLRKERKLLQLSFRRKCSWSADTLKMEPTTSSETSATIHKSKWCHIPPDCTECLFYRAPDHGICPGMSRRMQTVLADPTVDTKNSVASVRERTIPTERPPPVGEVSANFCG